MANGEPSCVFVGTYTRGTDSRGIYVYRFDNSTGALHETSVAEGIDNPSFLAVHPNGKYLYSSDEIDSFDGQNAGAVSAFAIDAQSGQLTLLNRQSAGGTSPCHLVVDPAGRHVLVVGYGSGTVAVLPIGDDGRLQPVADLIQHQGSSVDPVRQSSPHPHEIIIAPGGKFALVPDLGLDQIVQYRFDGDAGRLTANEPPHASAAAGAGPRHLAFHPDGRRAYVINELDLTVSCVRLRCTTWAPLSPRNDVHRPRRNRSNRRLGRGNRRPPQRRLPLHFASWSGSNRLIPHRSINGPADAARAHIDRGQNSSQFCDRSVWKMALGGESGLRNDCRLSHQGERPVRSNFRASKRAVPCLPAISR